MPSVANETRTASDVIGEAERCRREAIEMVRKDPKWSELLNQPSTWCVVVEKGLRPRAFYTMLEQDQLLERIERGYKVVLTVGLVGARGRLSRKQTMSRSFLSRSHASTIRRGFQRSASEPRSPLQVLCISSNP